MAVLYMDSFDHYATANMVAKGWVATNATITTGGRFGSRLSCASNGSNPYHQFTAAATIIVGFAFKFSSSSGTTFLQLQNVAGAVTHVSLALTGARQMTASGPGGVLGTGSTVFAVDTWYYVECKAFVNDTTGTVEVRINGSATPELNLSSKDTRNGSTTTIDAAVLAGTSAFNTSFDDFYVADTSGSAPTNDFLGDCRVEAIFPTGAGNYAQWTRGGSDSGANWSQVDEAAPNDDTDYNSSSTANQIDSFVYGNITPSSATIYGIQYCLDARKDDAGTRTIAPLSRQSSTDYPSATTHSLGTGYTIYTQVKEQNPATSAAWTVSDVNSNSEFGYKEIA